MSMGPSSTIITPNTSVVPGRQGRKKGVAVELARVEQITRWCPPCRVQGGLRHRMLPTAVKHVALPIPVVG
eukprot:3700648-Pyramimonas_sp.AAC.1